MAHGERDAVGDSGGDDSGECGDAFTRGAEKLPGALGGVTVELRSMAILMTPRERKPTSIFEALSRLQRKSPAAQSRMSDTEICATMRKLRRLQRRPGGARASSPLSALGIRARGTPCRSEAADKTSEEAEKEGVEKDAPVDVDGDIYRDGDGQAEGGERIGGPYGEKDPDGASREGKKNALEKELAESCARVAPRVSRTAISR
jgi:hypothetical protein